MALSHGSFNKRIITSVNRSVEFITEKVVAMLLLPYNCYTLALLERWMCDILGGVPGTTYCFVVGECLSLRGAGIVGAPPRTLKFIDQAVDTSGAGMSALADPIGVALDAGVPCGTVSLGEVGADISVLVGTSIHQEKECQCLDTSRTIVYCLDQKYLGL